MLDVGIWIRVSTIDQAQGESPKNHDARARMYAEMKGWNVSSCYNLSGVSGKSIIDHPEAKRMLSDVRSGRIKALIFSKLARLCRNVKELLEFAEIFKEHDAALVSLGESIDTSSPAGMLLFTVIGALAEWERNEISARVLASVPIRATQGKPLGGIGPWGYKWVDCLEGKRLKIDKEAAETIKLIFQICLEEEGNKSRTALRLNSMGVGTRRGAKWTVKNLDRIIDSSTYIGKRIANYSKSTGDGKHWVYKPKEEWIYQSVEPIISLKIWNQVQEFRTKRSARFKGKTIPKESKYIFGGLLNCECGKKLYVVYKTKDGPVYSCRSCNKKVTEMSLVDDLLGILEDIVISPELLESASDDKFVLDLREKSVLLSNESRNILLQKDRLTELLANGNVSSHTILDKIVDLEQKYDSLTDEVEQISNKLKESQLKKIGKKPLLEKAMSLTNLWEKLTYDEKRQLTKEILECIDLKNTETVFVLFWLPSIVKSDTRTRVHGCNKNKPGWKL